MEQMFQLALTIFILDFGFRLIVEKTMPKPVVKKYLRMRARILARLKKLSKAVIRWAGRQLWRFVRFAAAQVRRFFIWAWTHHRGAFVGSVAGLLIGALITYYIIGRLSGG